MSRTYRKGGKSKKKTFGNQYPSRMEQTAIKHAIPAFTSILAQLDTMRKNITHHRQMCGGHEYNNMSRTERSLKEATEWAGTVLHNLKEDAHWLTKS